MERADHESVFPFSLYFYAVVIDINKNAAYFHSLSFVIDMKCVIVYPVTA